MYGLPILTMLAIETCPAVTPEQAAWVPDDICAYEGMVSPVPVACLLPSTLQKSLQWNFQDQSKETMNYSIESIQMR